MQALKVIFASRIVVPIWLICLAVQTVFSPKLALEIMDNHYKQRQLDRKEKTEQLSK